MLPVLLRTAKGRMESKQMISMYKHKQPCKRMQHKQTCFGLGCTAPGSLNPPTPQGSTGAWDVLTHPVILPLGLLQLPILTLPPEEDSPLGADVWMGLDFLTCLTDAR